MSVRGTIGLAATLTVLIAVLVLTSRRPGDDALETLRPLVPGAMRSTTVEILRGDTLVAAFTKTPSGWSDSRITAFLEALASLPVIDLIDHRPRAPMDYGFSGDAVRLRLREGASRVVELELGSPNPAVTGVYVRRNGEGAILLTGALLRWEVEKLRSVSPTTAVP